MKNTCHPEAQGETAVNDIGHSTKLSGIKGFEHV